ncbi:MAG: FHA domain-containing protein [Myxococcota bacterium]
MGLLDRLKAMLGEARSSRDQFDRPDLRREVVQQILALKQRGRRGVETLPHALTVSITVAEGSVEVVRGFVDDPSFDNEIGAELLNRLVGARGDALPARFYAVNAGKTSSVVVQEKAAGVLARLRLPDGSFTPLDARRREIRVGRGPHHGSNGLSNDIALDEAHRFISRRAALIERAGSGVTVRSLDQGECLVVIRSDGKRIRPKNTRAGSVRLQPGDTLSFTDGGDQAVSIQIIGAEGEE